MPTIKPKILTINAEALFYYFSKPTDKQAEPFKLFLFKKSLSNFVIKQEAELEDCPLFYQFYKVLEADWQKKGKQAPFEIAEDTLYDKFIVVDFGDLFFPVDEESDPLWIQEKKKFLLANAQDLIENGLDLYFGDGTLLPVHMVAFDKSGNMSRKSRISFIDETFYDELNLRLNLGIDFHKSQLKVIESKYYAYRGLYLSSSLRVDPSQLLLTPETLVVLKDSRLAHKQNGKEDKENDEKPFIGYSYDKNIPLFSAKTQTVIDASGRSQIECTSFTSHNEDYLYVDAPFDGSGFITPSYASIINQALGLNNATSFQIRLPFAKGMLHTVDVHKFLDQYNETRTSKEHWYEDAFGIKRDLGKAKIFITESMFKMHQWLIDYRSKLLKNDSSKDEIDPMIIYCNALKKYGHALYVSGTNLPYGHTAYTHLSYQMINTLDFSKEQFQEVLDNHCHFIQNPIDFLNPQQNDSLENDDNSSSDDADLSSSDEQNFIPSQEKLPTWKRALFKNPVLKEDVFISAQLKNTQKSILTRIPKGKLLVRGQVRYLCRDLLPLLVSLLDEKVKVSDFWPRYLYARFYLPMDPQDNLTKLLPLDYHSYYALFRSPHLSRNEQCMMQPFISTSRASFSNDKAYHTYSRHLNLYNEYFGALTGIVMVPRGSSAPLCLGGADFDGDLVHIVFDQNVVQAVTSGAYTLGTESPYYVRKLPLIQIPSIPAAKVVVKEHVPFEHIKNTFSNRIGQIANASIALGQKEYGKQLPLPNGQEAVGDDSSDLSSSDQSFCAQCTLLTGLEIDAAKNGIHPDLAPILKPENSSNAYIDFLNHWKQLCSKETYKFNNLVLKKEPIKNTSGKMQLSVSLKDSKKGENAVFPFQAFGTYINLLPLRFEEEFSKYEKNSASSSGAIKFSSDFKALFPSSQKVLREKISKSEQDVVLKKRTTFQKQCEAVFSFYHLYTKKLFPVLKAEKAKSFYAPENLHKNLLQIYDRDRAEYLFTATIPTLQEKLAKSVSEGNTITDMMDRLNQVQWLLQPYHHRKAALEQIIGNGFCSSCLTDEEQELLFHFYQQGYKTLWLILSLIQDPKLQSFDTLKRAGLKKGYSDEKLNDLTDDEKFPLISLNKRLDKIMRNYYEHQAINSEEKAYKACLVSLRALIKKSDLDPALCFSTLSNITQKSFYQRKFFWDAFSWNDFNSYLRW